MPVNLYSLIPPSWQKLADISSLVKISEKLTEDYLPRQELIFKAFELAPEQVKVLILGQDPYPNTKHAVGLAFSTGDVRLLPASLKNIFRGIGE